MQLKPDTLLQGGKYRIIRVLGQGGFGITYEAEQVLLRRRVAVKEFFMKDCCERDEATSRVTIGTGSQRALVEKFRGKFLREAQMIAGMEHPHIVRVTDVFEENGTAYYVMDYLPGGSLSAKVKKEGPLSEAEAEKYVRQVADALAYVHSRNTVHLDVKPSNILSNAKGNAVLIDFGVSKHYDKAGEQTSSTPVGISKGYSPLEQSRDGDMSQFGPSTDIYALGATLYHLLTGQVPPEAAVVIEEGLRRPIGISERVWNTIEASMRPLRKDRPQTITEFLSLLRGRPVIVDDIADETVVRDSHDNPAPNRSRRSSFRSKTWLWVLLGGLVVLAAILALVFSNQSAEVVEVQPDEQGQPFDSTRGTINGHAWVDLGLPSGLKWATCNVGASSPEESGDYFAWGETSPKSEYDWEDYKFFLNKEGWAGLTLSKYVLDPIYGSVDNKTRLDLTDDAARVNWGGGWRIPTASEMNELRTECICTWTTQGGVNGYKVTSKANGNSLFLPATGFSSSSEWKGIQGNYWSSSVATKGFSAECLMFFDFRFDVSYSNRNYGFSVRPVLE